MRRFWERAVLSAVISVVVAIACLYVYDRNFTPQIVVFDVPTYLLGARTDFLKGTISEEQLKERLERLNSRLDGLSKNNIILNKHAVIAGGREIGDGAY